MGAKRIKRVFSNHDQVIHLWANQVQADARCKNVYFNGTDVYSYGRHYLLGRITEYKGVKLALINDGGYSVTTSKHVHSAWASVSHLVRLKSNDGMTPDKATIERALVRWQGELVDTFFNHFNRISFWDGYTAKSVADLRDGWNFSDVTEFNATAAALGFKHLVLDVDWTEYLALYNGHVEYRLALKNSPERAAKLAKRQAAQLAKMQVDVEAWRRGEKALPQDFRRTAQFQILRVRGEDVETSNGATVPLTHAIRLLKLIESGRVKQGERVGHFTFSRVIGTETPIVVIGCHNILLSEAQATLAPFRAAGLTLVKAE